jgi:hypothetical protein
MSYFSSLLLVSWPSIPDSCSSSSFAIYLGLIGGYPCVLVSLFHSSLVSLVVDHLVVFRLFIFHLWVSGVVILLTMVGGLFPKRAQRGVFQLFVECLSLTAYWSKSFKDDLVFQMYGLVTVCVCLVKCNLWLLSGLWVLHSWWVLLLWWTTAEFLSYWWAPAVDGTIDIP